MPRAKRVAKPTAPAPESHEAATARMLINTDTWPGFVLPVKNRKLHPERGGFPTVGVVNGIAALDGRVEIL